MEKKKEKGATTACSPACKCNKHTENSDSISDEDMECWEGEDYSWFRGFFYQIIGRFIILIILIALCVLAYKSIFK